jgi:hypothetical protein
MKTASSRTERFPKTLFADSQCRISKAKGSGDLLSRTPMHVYDRDGEDYNGSAIARGKTLDALAG